MRVGLLWHSLGSANLGVRALTLAQLSLLDRVAGEIGRTIEVRFYGNPDPPGAVPSGFAGNRVATGGTVVLTNRDLLLCRERLRADMAGCDLLLDIGEGDSFADLYGERRYLKLCLAKSVALATGRPLLLAPQTIGPFDGPLHGFWPSRLLTRCAAVFARDPLSLDFVRALAPDCPAAEATDLAFALPFDAPLPRPPGPVRIGVNISGLLWSDGAASRFGLGLSYPALVAALLEAFRNMPDTAVVLVPHVLGRDDEPDGDERIVRQLAGRYPHVTPAPDFADPRAAKSFIAGLDFFIGARMHACIAAFSAGVPLLVLAYSRKSTGLFASLGYEAVADLTQLDVPTTVALVSDALACRQALAEGVAAGNRIARRRLEPYEDALRRFLVGAAA